MNLVVLGIILIKWLHARPVQTNDQTAQWTFTFAFQLLRARLGFVEQKILCWHTNDVGTDGTDQIRTIGLVGGTGPRTSGS
ncbi:hypothetical protein XarbCFBP7604_16725 [Xanthomonas arboricola]|nr:hypothetical protein XarbCFBP7604_16725 [Xanthomonas arboricola]